MAYPNKHNFVITDELREDYEKFLLGETTYDEVKKKYNISLYQLTKLFDMMYVERTGKLKYMVL